MTGETSCAEVETPAASDEDFWNETSAGEDRLTQEDIEKLRGFITESLNKSNSLYKAHLETWKSDKSNKQTEENKDDENDNIEEAKVWALSQKQSFMNS